MTTINPRLLALIETLIASGVDWLAVELIETLNHGRWPEESEETLRSTRFQVRAGGAEKREHELAYKAVTPVPIPLEEQVGWAAQFVADRLDAALDDLAGSLTNLNAIIGESSNAITVFRRDRQPTTIRVGGKDAAVAVTAVEVEAARTAMQPLRAALARWASDTDGVLA